jgi:hypothetical protein
MVNPQGQVELIKYYGDRLKERIRNLIDRVIKYCKIHNEWKIFPFLQYRRKETGEIPK